MKKVFIIVLLILVSPIIVNAHPGRTDSSGCHTCRTNCSKWGLSTGEYHCHNGSSSSSSSSSKSSSKTTTVKKVVSKSKNTNMRLLYIDDKKMNIKDNMTYKTNKESVSISAYTDDSKATIKYDKDIDLEVGDNNITIKVIAEDTKYTKKYNVNIIRLSSDTSIDIFINDKSIKDNDVIEVSDSSIDLDYKTGYKGAEVEVIGDYKNLDHGKNEIKLIVTAEDGTKEEYNLIINRNYKNKLVNSLFKFKLNNNIKEIFKKVLRLNF